MPAPPLGHHGPAVNSYDAWLRRSAVVQLLRCEPRRVFPALLHAGVPGGLEAVTPARPPGGPGDHALRVEVVTAMLRRVGALPAAVDGEGVPAADPGAPAVLVWLTRTGPLELQDVDAGWVAATRAAVAESGLVAPGPHPEPATRAPAMVVVTRDGWWDPLTGSARRWARLRVR